MTNTLIKANVHIDENIIITWANPYYERHAVPPDMVDAFIKHLEENNLNIKNIQVEGSWGEVQKSWRAAQEKNAAKGSRWDKNSYGQYIND